MWELVDAHCAPVQGLRKTQHRCLEPPGEARPRGSAGREAQPPAHRTGQPLCPGPWGPTLRNACGDHCPGPSVPASIHTLRHLPHQRGCDHRACDSLTRSAGSPSGSLHAHGGSCSLPTWTEGRGGGKRRSPPDHAGIGGPRGLPPSLQGPLAGTPRQGGPLRTGRWRCSQVF